MPSDEVVGFASDDVEMEAAICAAKASIGQFFEAYFNPSRTQTSFLVKAVFDDGESMEHIWIADLDFSGERVRGVVANEPHLPTLKFMQPVEFDPPQITDWMYVDDGYLVGGYTTQVIRNRMTPDERREHDASAPFKFRNE